MLVGFRLRTMASSAPLTPQQFSSLHARLMTILSADTSVSLLYYYFYSTYTYSLFPWPKGTRVLISSLLCWPLESSKHSATGQPQRIVCQEFLGHVHLADGGRYVCKAVTSGVPFRVINTRSCTMVPSCTGLSTYTVVIRILLEYYMCNMIQRIADAAGSLDKSWVFGGVRRCFVIECGGVGLLRSCCAGLGVAVRRSLVCVDFFVGSLLRPCCRTNLASYVWPMTAAPLIIPNTVRVRSSNCKYYRLL